MARPPKIVKTGLMPKNLCLNLFGIYFTGDKSWINKYVINHEQIHDAQQRELLYIPFYILYVLEWLFRLLQYRNQPQAYLNISFEREAYSNERNLSYLSQRPPFSFLRYLRLSKNK